MSDQCDVDTRSWRGVWTLTERWSHTDPALALAPGPGLPLPRLGRLNMNEGIQGIKRRGFNINTFRENTHPRRTFSFYYEDKGDKD